jgi:exosome complex component RRP40
VIAIVEDRAGDFYRCNIFGPHPALLPLLAFEGATKRNKPNLGPGSLVFCRVAVSNNVMDPELTCIEPVSGERKDWMTDECMYNELKGGTSMRISPGMI